MKLPFFYIKNYIADQKLITLDEDTSRHVVQVLRMKEGEELNLTDGKGNLLSCSIREVNKKHTVVEVKGTSQPAEASAKEGYKPVRRSLGEGGAQGTRKVSVAISLLKNTNRFEWFLEKATEIGVAEIIPLVCERTEKEKFRYDRMLGICISAMLQSQQCWLPVLSEPTAFKDALMIPADQKFIAHCEEGNKQELSNQHIGTSAHRLICIGPEGDFSPGEIALALQHGFSPVRLGETRLRTETAGIVAAVLLLR